MSKRPVSVMCLSVSALALAAWGCADDPLPTSAPSGGIAVQVLPVAVAIDDQIMCEARNEGGFPSLKTVRLEVIDVGGAVVYDHALTQDERTRAEFINIAPGQGYDLRVTVCESFDGASEFVGEKRDVTLTEGVTESVPLYALPVGRYACPPTANGSVENVSPFAFGVALSRPDGSTTLLAGGFDDWSAPGNAIMGSDAASLFSSDAGTFNQVAPGGTGFGMGTGVVVYDYNAPSGPRYRGLVLGALNALVLGRDNAATTSLQAFGPLDETSVLSPFWLELDGNARSDVMLTDDQSNMHLGGTFAFGVGALVVPGETAGALPKATYVAAAGGLALQPGMSSVPSDQMTVLKFSSLENNARVVSMNNERIAPAVVSVGDALLAIVGGLQPTAGDLSQLIELFDVSDGQPTRVPLEVNWTGDGDQGLARGAAFSHAIPIDDGFVIIGGLPFAEGTGRILATPTEPTLYRVQLAQNETMTGWVASVSVPPLTGDPQVLGKVAFGTTVRRSRDEIWLFGSVSSMLSFEPAESSVVINTTTGAVAPGPSTPYAALGGSAAQVGGDTLLIGGGLITDAESRTRPTSAVVLRSSPEAERRNCAAAGIPPMDGDAGPVEDSTEP